MICGVIIGILWGAFVGMGVVETSHYADCKKGDFDSKYCKVEKKLCKFGEKDKSVCD